MRCGCPDCETYMVHSEGLALGCVCPACATRCRDCLGTNTLMSREALQAMKQAALDAEQAQGGGNGEEAGGQG